MTGSTPRIAPSTAAIARSTSSRWWRRRREPRPSSWCHAERGDSSRLPQRRDTALQLVLDMRADDLVERRFRLETEFQGAARIEAARPAFDDARDRRIRLPP